MLSGEITSSASMRSEPRVHTKLHSSSRYRLASRERSPSVLHRLLHLSVQVVVGSHIY